MNERERLVRDVVERCARVADSAVGVRSGYTGDERVDKEKDISASGTAASIANWIRDSADSLAVELGDAAVNPSEATEIRLQVRERVREAVGAALERVPELAHIRMIGPLVDYVSNAACEAAGLPAIRPTTDKGT